MEPFKRYVEIYVNVLVDGERAYTAYGVSGHLFDRVVRDHFCLGIELSFKFRVIDFCVSGGDDEYRL